MWLVRTSVDGMLHFDGTTTLDTHSDQRGQDGAYGVVAVDVPGTLVTAGLDLWQLTPTFDPVTSTVTLLTD